MAFFLSPLPFSFVLVWFLPVFFCLTATPYHPTDGWTYYLEAVRTLDWPECQYRFLSHPTSCESGTEVDLWNAAGTNQEWSFENTGKGSFYLKATSCGAYLSYPGDCNLTQVDLWPSAGPNQEFSFVKGNHFVNDQPGQFFIQAVGRRDCDFNWLSFPALCTTGSPDTVNLSNASGSDQHFLIFPASSSSPPQQSLNSQDLCADPFTWYDEKEKEYKLVCTGGNLSLMSSPNINEETVYVPIGDALSGQPSLWASSDSRWAPENIQLSTQLDNVIFVCDSQPSDGTHRIGYVWSTTGGDPQSWDDYSPSYLDLGDAPGGEIDPHVFQDPTDERYYLLWKSDDNNVGDTVTRLWMQEIAFFIENTTVKQLSPPQEILNSTGLWWADSFVVGGSLIEGPELVKKNGYYYLFFAAGKYCQDSYAEGVARSSSLWGPYEKLHVPLLSTGMVGVVDGVKLIGPGHASFILNQQTEKWYAVWHASVGENCNRRPFVTSLDFDQLDLWPLVDWQFYWQS